MDKAAIIEEIGRVQGEITKGETELRRRERQGDSAARNAWIAVIAMLLGIAGAVMIEWFTLFWFLAVIAAPVGLLCTFTESIRRDKLRKYVAELEDIVVQHKSALAKLQAQLIAA